MTFFFGIVINLKIILMDSLLLAIGVACASSALGEIVSWYLIYRHDEYK
jgi:hypothetical protein